MTHEPRRNELPVPPRPREMFCIHSYAGEAGPPCGWRGSVVDTRSDEASGAPRCPRCGRATLLPIPAPPAG